MRLPTWLLATILSVLVWASVNIWRSVFTPSLVVAVAEAGKGRVVVVRSPRGRVALVDTGSDASVLRVIGTTLPMWKRYINTIIITGDSTKEQGGLSVVRERYSVGDVMLAGTNDMPYGARLAFDGVVGITIVATDTSIISYDTNVLVVSSTTQPGVYRFGAER